MYTGKETCYVFTGNKNITKPSKVVLYLLEPLLNQGYSLGIDNYYALPELDDILLENKMNPVGTVRCNRKNLSQAVTRKKLKKGEIVKQFKGKVKYMKWRDKKDVNILSTIYESEKEEVTVAGKEALRPTVCIRYKKEHMAGVDLMDQITSYASLV